ncbi:MAG: ABC transporter permease [Chloroflexi bacterium]|nr:ABC transporter permease [Chloroflexota bacterium]
MSAAEERRPPVEPASGRPTMLTAPAAQPTVGTSTMRAAPAAESPLLGTLRRLLRTRKGLIGLGFLAGLLLIAAVGQVLTPYDPNEVHVVDQLKPPSAAYWFGTDELGRDIFSRVMYGAWPAVQAGVLAVVLAGLVGSITGLAAGYFGGWLDGVIGRIWDTLLAFPAIFLAIGIVSILGPGHWSGILAIAIINMPVASRLVRAVTVGARSSDYVDAARALGCSDWRIMLAHILPNCLAPLVVQMAIAAPEAILVEATLSFLGLGAPLPAPTWGNLLSAAQAYLSRSWTYALFPGLAITLAVIGLNYFADALQDAIDPRRIRAAAKAA